jgi:hypothetical protein
MNLDFPIESVSINISSKNLAQPSKPLLLRPHLKIDESDFFLDVCHVARYLVKNGNDIYIYPHEGADIESVKIFLNGSVLGAVLHQQGLLPLHGSSFEYKGKGVVICGHSGVGKSFVTAAFCQNGAHFINDDITPCRITKSETFLIPIKSRIKLWDDSIRKLNIKNEDLEKIRPMLDKFYLPPGEIFPSELRLDHLFVLATHNKDEFAVNELAGMDKHNMLRKQIYRRVYLKGMPETEKKYFKQLFQLATRVRVTQVIRPQICDIYDTMRIIEKEINR